MTFALRATAIAHPRRSQENEKIYRIPDCLTCHCSSTFWAALVTEGRCSRIVEQLVGWFSAGWVVLYKSKNE